MPKLFLSTHACELAEPTQNLSVEISTETSAEVESAPTSELQSVNPQPITDDEEPLVPDEEERERCVLESRKWDEAQKDYEEFYEDELDDIYE
jgi:hypothetical protein